jgi:hypothetical protein
LNKYLKRASLLAGGVAMTAGMTFGIAGAASASSYGCNASVGCATLNGHQPNGTAISFDAKKKNPDGIVIGYPDFKLDEATSFDKVAHTFPVGVLKGDTYYTFVYAPTGDWSNQCATADNSGELSLQTCTLGHDPAQQFVAGAVDNHNNTIQFPVSISNYPGNQEFVLENMAGLNPSATHPFSNAHLLNSSFLGNPLTPVANGAPDGRQLNVNGIVNVDSHTSPGPMGHFGDQPESWKVTSITVPDHEQWIWHT